MSTRSKRSGFTLVEVMIVVVIMAILAASVVPQFTSSSDEAKTSTADFNKHTLDAQIQLYKAEHEGEPPTTLGLLAESTDKDHSTAGDDFGPYISEIPANPYDGKTDVATSNDGNGGWWYDSSTGELGFNHEIEGGGGGTTTTGS